jgi:hypothetical protein
VIVRLVSMSRSTRSPTANEDGTGFAPGLLVTLALWPGAVPVAPCRCDPGPPVAVTTSNATAAATSATSPNASRR